MKADTLLRRAEKHRQEMEKALAPINRALSLLFDDYNASVFYQPSDGWVILFDDDHSARLSAEEIDCLLSMSREHALEFLRGRSI